MVSIKNVSLLFLIIDFQTYSYEQPEKRTYTDANNKARTNLFVESGWR